MFWGHVREVCEMRGKFMTCTGSWGHVRVHDDDHENDVDDNSRNNNINSNNNNSALLTRE